MFRALMVLAVIVLSSIASTGIASALECEMPVRSAVEYAVDEKTEGISVNAVVWPQISAMAAGCTTLHLEFPVVPGVQQDDVVVTDAPTAYEVRVHAPDADDRSSLVEVIFSADGLSSLSNGFTLAYSIRSDDDWVIFDDHSARFPIWTVGEVDGGTVSVRSGASDAIVTTADRRTGASAVGIATFSVEGSGEFGTHAAVQFGNFEGTELSGDLLYFVDRSNPDPDPGVVEGAVEALAALEGLLGPRPNDWKTIDIVEVDPVALGGYAGRHDAGFELVHVDVSIDQDTIIHELAHSWFNDAVFVDPWLSEGFAQYMAIAVEESTPDTDGLDPIVTQAVSPADIALVVWDSQELIDATAEAQVDYGYAASLWVIDRIAAEVGPSELLRYASSIARSSVDSGSPVTSEQFLVGLEQELGFTDRENVYAAFVFGEEGQRPPAGGVGVSAMPPLVSKAPNTGFGPIEMGLLVGVMAAVMVGAAVVRSLRTVPLGGMPGSGDSGWENWDDGSDSDGDYSMAGSSDSEWPF